MVRDDAGDARLRAELGHAGLAVTQPRLRVLALFREEPDRHFSVTDVQRAMIARGEHISLTGLYSVLRRLAEVNLLVCRFAGGHKVFALAGHPQGVRVVCSLCRRESIFRDAAIDEVLGRAAEAHGLALAGYAVALHGCCRPRCVPSGEPVPDGAQHG